MTGLRAWNVVDGLASYSLATTLANAQLVCWLTVMFPHRPDLRTGAPWARLDAGFPNDTAVRVGPGWLAPEVLVTTVGELA